MAIHAVLTGDIVNFTRLSAAEEKRLIKKLEILLKPHPYEFYRGDSFQVYCEQADDALYTALSCRTTAMGIAGEKAVSDVRISIGIGRVKTPVSKLAAAKGEAFILSGRAFDETAKTGARLYITSSNLLANEGLQTIADYINAIFRDMTSKQAIVIYQLLQNETQQKIALQLKKSKSTIHQLATSGRWSEIEELMERYQRIIKLIS